MGFCSNEMSILFWHTHTMSRPMRKKSAILFWNDQLRKNLRKVSKIDRNWISINSKKTSNLDWDSKPSRIGLVLLPGWPWGWNVILRIRRRWVLSDRSLLEWALQIEEWIIIHFNVRQHSVNSQTGGTVPSHSYYITPAHWCLNHEEYGLLYLTNQNLFPYQ